MSTIIGRSGSIRVASTQVRCGFLSVLVDMIAFLYNSVTVVLCCTENQLLRMVCIVVCRTGIEEWPLFSRSYDDCSDSGLRIGFCRKWLRTSPDHDWNTASKCVAHYNSDSSYAQFYFCGMEFYSVCERNATLLNQMWDPTAYGF